MGSQRRVQVEVLDLAAVEQLAGKVEAAAALPEMSEKARLWRETNPASQQQSDGFAFAVVGETLMYLHRAPDGLVIPHACYPDGTEKVYTDHLHAETAYA